MQLYNPFLKCGSQKRGPKTRTHYSQMITTVICDEANSAIIFCIKIAQNGNYRPNTEDFFVHLATPQRTILTKANGN